ncbi:hypothetical protein V1520DRAFT_285023 [Lipomyces starkeyi]|uniref:Uncharacterized protein n=1 Tax=Lipomyces starkeyi NRRL Y-11557 TaxID=675824 RepID=A0A1E3PZS9_LIPST|nr:hypothetical protein LIPSTDRAFT_164133 [Lipomyces starkeyi NRRL Y-11557]
MRREQIHLTADESLSSSNSPRILVNDGRSRYHMEPDGVIFFQTKRSLDYKVVVEIGISQTLDGLLEKARKWIFGKKCKVVFLLGFNEKSRYSAPPRHIFMGSREVDEQVEEMRLQWEAQDHSEFGPVVLQGHTWLDNICEGFIEVVRLNPHSDGRDASDALFRRSYDLINQGMNESSGVARSVGELRLDELIPRESLGNEAAGDIVIDFFDADDFMSIVRRAMINTAVDRFENAIKIV